MDVFKNQFSQIHKQLSERTFYLEKKYPMWRILLVTDLRTWGFYDAVVYGLEILSKPFLGRCVQRFYLPTLGYSTIHIFASEHKNFHDPSFK